MASRSAYQSGLRNVYPILPLLAIYTGRVLCAKFPHVPKVPREAGADKISLEVPLEAGADKISLAAQASGRRARVAAAALGLWLALIALTVHPHYLSYYNALVGGPTGGIRAAVGSVDLDWGQGLVGLRREMEARGIREIVLASPGTTDPAIYGIHARRIYGDDLRHPERLPAGVYAVSTTYVRGRVWLRRMEPFARVGNVLWLYRISPPPP
jgi:hypothetical protein